MVLVVTGYGLAADWWLGPERATWSMEKVAGGGSPQQESCAGQDG
jgi:hypothetical protein